MSLPLTHTRLDLVPFDLGAVLTAGVLLYLLFAASAFAFAIIKPRNWTGKVIASSAVAIVFGYLPGTLALQALEAKEQARIDQADLANLKTAFFATCFLNGKEIVPDRPVSVKHLYILDKTENVRGAWGFYIFDTYDWNKSHKTDNGVSFVSKRGEALPGEGNYLLTRAVIGQQTLGKLTYRGVRQELVEITSGEVKATRTNFFLGDDFARGISCLDQNWYEGFRSFVVRSIGFSPSYIRSDSWVRTLPRLFLRGEVVSRRTTDEKDFRSPIYPLNSKYDYNKRQLVIDGIGYYLSQRFNNDPLRVVGVRSFQRRTLILYETDQRAPSIKFMIYDKATAQGLQEVFVRLPAALRQDAEGGTRLHRWRIANDSVSFNGGKIRFDVVQLEETTGTSPERYVSYTLEAPWQGEDVESESLPEHLSDGHYGRFALREQADGKKLVESEVIGQWISQPAGALWNFKEDKTVSFGGNKWDWKIVDGVVFASHNHPNMERAKLRASRDGGELEVAMSSRVGTYEPFIIRRVEGKY